MSVYVSRQRYFDDNRLAVELACGGSKYSGKDILPVKFGGEGRNLVSPIDAVNVAIRIIDEWNLTYFDENKSIALVNADGKGIKIYYNPHDKKDLSLLQQWATKAFNSMKKCGNCQKPISNMSKMYELEDLPNKVGCSEVCIATLYRTIFGVEAPRVVSNRDKLTPTP
jgi:hypothetical protein